jgi:shikimate kinase / 3-dehydroquinate synthase
MASAAGIGAPIQRAIVLIGFMGAGKSSVATELAQALGVSARDSDALLEDRLGESLQAAFETQGEAAAREHEERLVCELLAGAQAGDVISLGGGSVLSPRVREALRAHLVVLLDVDPREAWERVSAQANGAPTAPARPLASDLQSFVALHAVREPIYESLADALLMGLAPGDAARAAGPLAQLSRAPDGTRLIWAVSSSGAYPVFVAPGLLRDDAESQLSALWPVSLSESRAFCVSDESVSALYRARVAFAEQGLAVPPGEGSKTLASAERVWSAMAGAGITRADHVVALGGGVVGDLAGFCAATYQRGIPVVQVPTTLLAQVDSAYGGKTGVDLPLAKNYVGSYHLPAGVLVDPGVLATLPQREYAAGWVEVLKTALIAGGGLWERVAAGEEVDERMILACARTKIAIVAEDERDSGRRQALNLGHTVGHAIEAATGYARYRHGEAVGLGLLAALRLSHVPEIREQVRELLLGHGLPVQLEGATVESVLEALARDKKRLGATVPFVLARAPGEVSVQNELASDEVRGAVTELVA